VSAEEAATLIEQGATSLLKRESGIVALTIATRGGRSTARHRCPSTGPGVDAPPAGLRTPTRRAFPDGDRAPCSAPRRALEYGFDPPEVAAIDAQAPTS